MTAYSLLPTPTASDANRRPSRTRRPGSGGRDLITAIIDADLTDSWSDYRPAIRRWESRSRPAPEPTEPNKRGGRRVNVAFVEWMVGMPEGWVTDSRLSRQDQLWIIGNSVVLQQAVAALSMDLLQNATDAIRNEPS